MAAIPPAPLTEPLIGDTVITSYPWLRWFTDVPTDVSGVGVHNSLSGLQGGGSSQYYHMTLAEHTESTRYSNAAANGLLSSTDWNTFSNKQDALSFGDLTAGSVRIAIGGTGANALIGAGANVDVVEANLSHANFGGLQGGQANEYYHLTSAQHTTTVGWDHGTLNGLSDDDHAQYYNAARLNAWVGSANITTLGTVGTGTWNGTALSNAYVPNHDDLLGFVAAEHIDWTNASSNFYTTGTGRFDDNLGVNIAPISGSSIYTNRYSNDSSGPQHAIEGILTQGVASAQDIASGQTVIYSNHTSGTITEMKGYYGGAVVNSNSAVTGAHGLFGAAFGAAGKTAAVTILSGVTALCAAHDLAVTYALGFYGQAPTIDTGSITNAITAYLANPSSGTNNWSLLCDGDIQVATGASLYLEGSLAGKGDSYLTFDSGNNWIEIWAQNHESLRIDANGIDVNGPIRFQELSADPTTPAEGEAVMWMSDGTGSGDDGDIMIKIQAGSTTKTVTLVDFSAA